MAFMWRHCNGRPVSVRRCHFEQTTDRKQIIRWSITTSSSATEFHYGHIHPHLVKGQSMSSLHGNVKTELWHAIHDDVIKRKHFLCYWPFVREIYRSPVNSHHKGQWRIDLMFSFICVWTNGWANHWDAGDLRPYRARNDVTVMSLSFQSCNKI